MVWFIGGVVVVGVSVVVATELSRHHQSTAVLACTLLPTSSMSCTECDLIPRLPCCFVTLVCSTPQAGRRPRGSAEWSVRLSGRRYLPRTDAATDPFTMPLA